MDATKAKSAAGPKTTERPDPTEWQQSELLSYKLAILSRLLERGMDRRFVGYVAVNELSPRVRRNGVTRLVSDIHRNDLCAVAGKVLDHRLAHSACAAGDDDTKAFDIRHQTFPVPIICCARAISQRA